MPARRIFSFHFWRQDICFVVFIVNKMGKSKYMPQDFHKMTFYIFHLIFHNQNDDNFPKYTSKWLVLHLFCVLGTKHLYI